MFRRSLAVLSIVALTTAGVAGSAAAGGYHYGYGSYKYKHYHSHKHYHRHKGGNTAGKVLLGVGAGLLFLSVLNAANKPRDPYYRGYSVPAEPPRYVPRPGPIPQRISQPAPPSNSCLQTREYQTVVIIGGQEREAYGTACLQPDGSWLQGPATPVPDY